MPSSSLDVRYVRLISAIPRQLDDPSPSISLITFSMYSRSCLSYGDVENLTKSLSVWTPRVSERVETASHILDLLQPVVIRLLNHP